MKMVEVVVAAIRSFILSGVRWGARASYTLRLPCRAEEST